MIKEMAEYPFPQKNILSFEEECFKKQCFDSFGMKVRLTLLSEAAYKQQHLYIWADDAGVYQEKALIGFYINCFGLNEVDLGSFYVTILDFKTSMQAYAYGHAIGDINISLKNDRLYNNIRTYLDYSTNVFVFVKNHWKEDEEKKCADLCWVYLKKYDYYNLLKNTDLRMKFLTSEYAEKHAAELNDIFQTNSFM